MKRIAIISPLEEHPPLEGFSRIVNLPRYGTTCIATVLRDAGYEVRAFSEFVRCEVDWDYVFSADYVCFSLLSFCSHRGYDMADRIRTKTSVPIVFGGSHPSVLPTDCLGHCDYVVRNEGEGTILELLGALERGAGVEDILGISYRSGD
ncbi:MAG: cobalamin-dependent protein, partial [Planctomycetota bacterium]